VWECETIDVERLTRLLRRFLRAGPMRLLRSGIE